MKKILKILVAANLFLTFQVLGDTRVLVCDSCTTSSSAQSYAIQNAYVPSRPFNPFEPPPEHMSIQDEFNETISVVNLKDKIVHTFSVNVLYGDNFVSKHASPASTPSALIDAVYAYDTFKSEMSFYGEVGYSAIPIHLSRSSTPIAGAPISSSYSCTIKGARGYPVPPSVANSVTNLSNNIDKQRAVAEMLRGTITASSLGYITEPVKDFVSKLLKLRPVPVVTTFNDGSFVQWQILDLRGTIPAKILSDTAHDANCNKVPLNDELGVFTTYGGGRYENWDHTTLPPVPNVNPLQVCITTWTRGDQSAEYTPQVTCWFEYHG